jgi:murein DD-endopeptidase MepM/ murein hydrolase activator NlpD
MKQNEGGYTVVLVPKGSQRTRSLELTPGALRVGAAVAVVGGLALVTLAASWWYFAAQAARVPGLEQQVSELQAENAKVQQLAASLAALQAEYEKIRRMLGSELLAAAPPLEILPAEEPESAAEGGPARGLSPEIPTSWPLATSGFVTQVVQQAQGGPHPGVDIAVAQHSYIRAAGAGVVLEAGADSVYGLYVLIEHGRTGYRSMYGHASRLFVTPGDRVRRNQVVALSGNTGRSTAPHLHFEILQEGTPIDPLTLVQQR